MAILNEYSPPKGNDGMTLFGNNNDDTTVTLPALPFTFMYNGAAVNAIYASGNTWLGFGVASEHFSVNRRDTSYNALYYANEVEFGRQVFRIRFEGNSTYSSWGSNNLIWEFSVFEDGVFRLVVEASPNNAGSSFNNPGVGSQATTFLLGHSYIFISPDNDGRNYTITEGNYIPCQTKYLCVDEEGVKAFVDGVWEVIGEPPITAEMLQEYGADVLPQDLTGLLDNAEVYFFTDDPAVLESPENHALTVRETVTSKPKIIVQTVDFELADVDIVKLEFELVTSKRDTNGNAVSTNGRVRAAFSFDDGSVWYTFNNQSLSFETLDIADTAAFLENGLNPSAMTAFDYAAFNALRTATLQFAYILEKPTLTDVAKVRKTKITYASGVAL